MISLIDIYKSYIMGDTTFWALNGISLQVDKGEFVAIMGPSGSGKSTLMNILGCLDVPTKGKYFFEGIEVNKLTKNEQAELRNKKIGFVFQSFNLLPRTSALENVELPLMYNSNISEKKIKTLAYKALEMVGLADRAHHYPSQLSGGQQQRVAIARAIVNNPTIIFADEPTGNLDSHMSEEIMTIFRNLNNNGITIILVTHEKDIASYAKRNITFRDGKIISDIRLIKNAN